MKSMKLMLPALLLSLSIGAYAQDDDELLDATSEDEATEVFVPKNRWEKPIFHRLQLGYTGTFAKYTSNYKLPGQGILGDESHYISGINLGWLTDIVLTKNRNIPLYIGVGGVFAFQTGHYNGEYRDSPTVNYKWLSRVYGFSLTIPVTLSYQFKDVKGVEGLTLSPFAGLYGRFNFVADRKLEKTTEFYHKDINGVEHFDDAVVEEETKSLRKNYSDGWMKGRNHVGKLFQVGAQVGVNAFYKRYSFGLAYMIDINPFAEADSPDGITKEEKSVGGYKVIGGTGADMEISTRHNFAITVGLFF